jgi:subtilisin family serine protease
MRPFARLALCLLAAAGPAFAAAPGDTGAGAPPRIVVAFANEPLAAPGPAGTTGTRYAGTGYRIGQNAEREKRSVASDYALREVASWPIQLLSMHCVVFEIRGGRPVDEVVAALSKDTRVALAQPLQEFHTLTAEGAAPPAYNDPLYDLQTNLTSLGISRAHERAQGAGVRIALIDTGVDLDHPDLRGAQLHSRSFIERAAYAASAASLRHGTAMAGLIAAVANNHIGIVGIAPRAQIEVFEACWQLAPGNDAAVCNTFTLARALAAALAAGSQLVNLSFAGPADPLLTALVQAGLKRGVTFVGAAAGADAPFPTAIAGVITASGSEQPPRAAALGAPAQHVLTLRPGGEYDFESGSSVAAAEITAVMALLMSASPTKLSTATLVSLLSGPSVVQAGALQANTQPPVDVNAALARLDAAHGGGVAAVAARVAQP